jgi:hypothetical protein
LFNIYAFGLWVASNCTQKLEERCVEVGHENIVAGRLGRVSHCWRVAELGNHVMQA